MVGALPKLLDSGSAGGSYAPARWFVSVLRQRPNQVRFGFASATEPACAPGRTKLLLLEGVLARRLVSLGLGLLAPEEVDLDLAYESCAELGVTDA